MSVALVSGAVRNVVAIESEYGLKDDRSREGRGHGGDFAPGVDAPPIPSENQYGARSRARDEKQFPGPGDRIHIVGDYGGDYGEQHGGDLRCAHVMAIRRDGL